MTNAYKVVAPYVTLKVKDVGGSEVLKGFYSGGLVFDPTDDEQVKAHLAMGFLERTSAPEVESPQDDAPKGNASREDWAAYAATKGASEEETRSVEEGGLKQTELREKYGN